MAEKTLKQTKPSPQDVMDQLIEDFKCSICLEVYIDATWTTCQHLFCRFCITKWLQFSPKCPACHSSVTSCIPMKVIDDQVDGLFQTLPLSIRKDRDEVKERRRKMETEGTTGIEHINELLKTLRAHKDRVPLSLPHTDDSWFEKISSYGMDEKENGINNSNNSKFQLPRLVPAPVESNGGDADCKLKGGDRDKDRDRMMGLGDKGKDQHQTENKSKLSNTSQYENLKLPPIRPAGKLGRQSRGITTTTCSQNAEDKFPMNMEGDISKDSGAEDNIRELERRNKFLEDQLFGAYDRILEAIKENDETMAKQMDPNVFRDSKQRLKQGGGSGSVAGGVNQLQQASFSKESMINTADEEELQLQQGPTNEVDDLLAETEDLMEIEDFLKKFPFERIRDDDELLSYNMDTDDFDDLSYGLEGLIDPDQLEQIAAQRKQRAKKPLTKEQETIENFYKKLVAKQQKEKSVDGEGSNHGVQMAIKVSKSVTQETSSSKLKRIPSLNQNGPGPVRIPSNQSLDPLIQVPSPMQTNTSSLNRTGSKLSLASKASRSNLNLTSSNINNINKNNSSPQGSLLHASKSILNSLDKFPNKIRKTNRSKAAITSSNNNNISDKSSDLVRQQTAPEKKSFTTSSVISNTTLKKTKRSVDSSSSPFALAAAAKSDKNPKSNKGLDFDPELDLNYDDFLKLEVDFLDGDGDWKQFEKPPDASPPSDSLHLQNKRATSTSNAKGERPKGKSNATALLPAPAPAKGSNAAAMTLKKLKKELFNGGNNISTGKKRATTAITANGSQETDKKFNSVLNMKNGIGNVTDASSTVITSHTNMPSKETPATKNKVKAGKTRTGRV